VAWLALRVAVPPEVADAVADVLVEAGAPAVIREETRNGLVVEAHSVGEDQPRLLAALRAYLADHPEAGAALCETNPLPDADWEASFRDHHHPLAVGRRLLVAPPWDVPASPGREVLVVDPGRAFGTGQHATTRGCLEEIEDAVATGTIRRGLDVGTGSGILAAALARLGVPCVVAVDRDLDVPPLARATLDRNGASHVRLFVGTADSCRGVFDLVVANLLADTIVEGAPGLAARTGSGGRLVLSGLLERQLDRVTAAFPGWQVAAVRAEDEWRTVRLVRRADSC
jgi:ribosomal protein L11 methyltransferase